MSSSKIRILNKLARNNLHENLAEKGGKAITRTLTDDEYQIALYNKLQEEVGEFLETPIPEELADILEVIHALAPFGSRFLGRIRESPACQTQSTRWI